MIKSTIQFELKKKKRYTVSEITPARCKQEEDREDKRHMFKFIRPF